MALTTGGSLLLVVTASRSLLVWDVLTGTLKRTIDEVVGVHVIDARSWIAARPDGHWYHADVNTGITPGPDDGTPERHLASSARTGVVALLTGDELILVRPGPASAPGETARRRVGRTLYRSAAFSRDAAVLACGDAKGVISLWDARTLQPLAELPGHPVGVSHLEISPDGEVLLSLGTDGQAKLWEVSTGEALLTLPQSRGAPFDAWFTQDGRALVVIESVGDHVEVVSIGTDLPLGLNAANGSEKTSRH